MTDIVKRLRETYPATYAFTDMPHIGQEAADEIERLRQRVKEQESETIANERIARNLENELAELRKAQGEPVAVVRSVTDSEVRIKWIGGFPQIGSKLYTSAQSIPEG